MKSQNWCGGAGHGGHPCAGTCCGFTENGLCPPELPKLALSLRHQQFLHPHHPPFCSTARATNKNKECKRGGSASSPETNLTSMPQAAAAIQTALEAAAHRQDRRMGSVDDMGQLPRVSDRHRNFDQAHLPSRCTVLDLPPSAGRERSLSGPARRNRQAPPYLIGHACSVHLGE